MAARERKSDLQPRAARIAATLARLYPDARISLDFETPWQCLAATILSAQCTDERVNKVTPALFRGYPDARATARADPRHLQR
ncbi:MAG: endonuclease III domain-containing protein, partial [Candidatus Binataceae bacterium]